MRVLFSQQWRRKKLPESVHRLNDSLGLSPGLAARRNRSVGKWLNALRPGQHMPPGEDAMRRILSETPTDHIPNRKPFLPPNIEDVLRAALKRSADYAKQADKIVAREILK